jgi:ribonucleotide monophosphatase NagD (HAD superfamily)
LFDDWFIFFEKLDQKGLELAENEVSKIYMIGDSIYSDIKGAN